MSREPVTVFLVQRIGPYHHARLRAWAATRRSRLHVIEFRAGDGVYAWAPVADGGEYARWQTRSNAELVRALDEIQPVVVVCVGYADPEISQAMKWALRRRVPLVTCSDSTAADEARTGAKEWLKRRVLAGFDAALVAGCRSGEYLRTLGIDARRQFQPWDVVDNEHFARGARADGSAGATGCARLLLPVRYFLCVARFVPKKNLPRLIAAYAHYAARAGAGAWSLVLSGSGPQEAELRQLVAAAGLDAAVHFPGFLQYADLPECYGRAGAFVLPSVSDQWGLVVNEAMAAGLPVIVSSRCGCAPDLVREDGNGFTFAPTDVKALADCLQRLAEMDPARRAALGRKSREMIAAFSPSAFAAGMNAAVAAALERRPAARPWGARLAAQVLSMRSAVIS